MFLASVRVAVPGTQAAEPGLHCVPAICANLRSDVQECERLKIDALRFARVAVMVCKDAAEGHSEGRVPALAGHLCLAQLTNLLFGPDLQNLSRLGQTWCVSHQFKRLWTNMATRPPERKREHILAAATACVSQSQPTACHEVALARH